MSQGDLITWADMSKKEKKRLENNTCPNCGGMLVGGPSGGAAQNIACSQCWSEFNVMPFGFYRMGVLAKQRANNVYGGLGDAPRIKVWIRDDRPFWKRWFRRA